MAENNKKTDVSTGMVDNGLNILTGVKTEVKGILKGTPPSVPPPSTPTGVPPTAVKKVVKNTDTNGETKGKSKTANPDSKSADELNSDEYWQTVKLVTEKASREQQLKLAKMLCGLLGANVSFPSVRENRLMKEIAKASPSKKEAPTGVKAKKPENAQLKASDEYKEFVKAENALRAAKTKFSIAKSDKTDLRVQQEANDFEEAKKKFLDLKSKLKPGWHPDSN